MNNFLQIHKQVYKQGQLFNVNKKLTSNPLQSKGFRANAVAVAGGALGDEGKGRVTDELTAHFLKQYKKVVHYRDNGGANAGHTVEIGDIRIGLHQLGSGILQKGCTVIIGKEMVVHPEDLVTEIDQVKQKIKAKKLPAELKIDEMAFLSLDTHRAFEAVLKWISTGSKGGTGRGIAPAYADVIYRHPLRMRDLMARDWQARFVKHYRLYQDWIKGFGYKLTQIEVPRLSGEITKTGSVKTFLNKLSMTRTKLRPYVQNVYEYIAECWTGQTPMVFEKAQALGLDKRWGIYPDVTASNCGFDGIFSSTEGIVDPWQLPVRAATIKATYSSSVGERRLPTIMKNKLADRIREDAYEYGTTTKRPRDIAYIDLPMLSYLFRVGRVQYLALTHLDISYTDTPIKVCIAYKHKKTGQEVTYRPDQTWLDQVKPEYVELPSWDNQQATSAQTLADLPVNALKYIAFLTSCLQVKPFMLTTGPKREQSLLYW